MGSQPAPHDPEREILRPDLACEPGEQVLAPAAIVVDLAREADHQRPGPHHLVVRRQHMAELLPGNALARKPRHGFGRHADAQFGVGHLALQAFQLPVGVDVGDHHGVRTALPAVVVEMGDVMVDVRRRIRRPGDVAVHSQLRQVLRQPPCELAQDPRIQVLMADDADSHPRPSRMGGRRAYGHRGAPGAEGGSQSRRAAGDAGHPSTSRTASTTSSICASVSVRPLGR